MKDYERFMEDPASFVKAQMEEAMRHCNNSDLTATFQVLSRLHLNCIRAKTPERPVENDNQLPLLFVTRNRCE